MVVKSISRVLGVVKNVSETVVLFQLEPSRCFRSMLTVGPCFVGVWCPFVPELDPQVVVFRLVAMVGVC